MDDPLDAGRLGRVEDVGRAADVDADEVLHLAPLADVGGGVDDEVDALERLVERGAVGDVGEREARPRLLDPAASAGVDFEADDLAALGDQPPCDRGADEAAGPGDRNGLP